MINLINKFDIYYKLSKHNDDNFISFVEMLINLISIKSKKQKKPIKIVELGSGFGILSLPIIEALQKKGDIQFEWCAYEINKDLISIYKNTIEKWEGLKNGARKNILDVLKDTVETHRASLFEESVIELQSPDNKNVNKVKVYNIDIQKIAYTEDNSDDKYDVLYAPFFFNQILGWSGVWDRFYNNLNKNGLIILGKMGGDWWATEGVFDNIPKKRRNEKIIELWEPIWEKLKKIGIPHLHRGISALNIQSLKSYIIAHGGTLHSTFKLEENKKINITEILTMIKEKVFSPFKIISEFASFEEILNVITEDIQGLNEEYDFNSKQWFEIYIKTNSPKPYNRLPAQKDLKYFNSSLIQRISLKNNYKKELNFWLHKCIEGVLNFELYPKYLDYASFVYNSPQYSRYWENTKEFFSWHNFYEKDSIGKKNTLIKTAFYSDYLQKGIMDFSFTDFLFKILIKNLNLQPIFIFKFDAKANQIKFELVAPDMDNNTHDSRIVFYSFTVPQPITLKLNNDDIGIPEIEYYYNPSPIVSDRYRAKKETYVQNIISKMNDNLKPSSFEIENDSWEYIKHLSGASDSIKEKIEKILNAMAFFLGTKLFISIPITSFIDNQFVGISNLWLSYSKRIEIDSKFKDDITYLTFPYLQNFVNMLYSQELNVLKLKHALRSAVAAIMSRNMSHNIGSHVLSSIPIEEIEKRKYDISKFNSYLQQRMDFLARVSTEWPETGEYLCFYTDLMRNFLKQSLLLEKIIKDDGVEGKKIKIHLKVNNSSPITFSRDYESHIKNTKEAKCAICKGENDECGECEFDYRTKEKERMNVEDLLIQLPGGMLGTQAFYIILENIMRNSAKYNRKSCEYEIYIEIGENKDLKTSKDNVLSYKVRIYDNFSENKNGYNLEKNGKIGTLVQLLQEKLEKPLIKNTGEIIEKDWGIQEIKIAAKFLNYPFEEEKIGISTKEKDNTKKYVWVEECERNVGDGNEGRKTKLTSYVFSIPKAKLVLCVDHQKKEEINKAEGKGVFAADFEDEKFVEKMKKSSPEILYFEINEGNEVKDTNRFKEVLEKIEKYKFFLPTRIVIAVKNNLKGKLEQELKIRVRNHEIPPRRLIICPLEEIAEINGENSIENFIISVYKQWVFRWHEKELMEGEKFKNVGIAIYFDRDKEFTGFKKWETLQTDLKEDKYKLTNIKFSFFDKSQKAMEISDFDKNNLTDQKIDLLLGFDNHGIIINEFRETKNWNFYQIIGHDLSVLKMNNHSMFNLLQNIPTGFAGVMIILSLIESAFARVAVVDERVANWAFEEIDDEFLFKHEGVIPQNILGANVFISASVKVDHRHQLVGKKKRFDFKVISENKKTKNEGITISEFRFLMGKEIKTIEDLDILIIHLGFLNEVFEKDKDKQKVWLTELHKKIPKIVMISGRGYKPDEVPLELPFREASLVTNYISTDFNKLNLVKGLISPRGNIHEK